MSETDAAQDPRMPFRIVAGLDAEGVAVARAIAGRRSVRGFLPTPLEKRIVEAILALASRAPSGTNIQPWHVHACTGTVRDALSVELMAAYDARAAGDPAGQEYVEEYAYYPRQWREPYLARRRKLGWDYYATVGLTREDKAGMHRQHGRNFAFFGAPVGLFFTLDRDMERGSWLDAGMFIQNVMIAARAFGLETCPQAAFGQYHRIVRRHLGIPDDQILLCGMSLGFEDKDAPENRLVSEREPVDAFARWSGW